jgi:uncharacterized membrane protein YccC
MTGARFGLPSAIFSLKCLAAATLALWISLSIGLERPYWSFLTSYIVAQPLAGAVLSKAVFRIVGTAVGAAVTVFMVPNLVNTPALLVLAFAGWLALCVYVSLLDRTPRAYMFVLAGYSACLIGLPSLDAPGQIFTVAILRVQEITLGILCGSLVHGLVLPGSVTELLLSRVDAILRDAERWSRDAISSDNETGLDAERRRLAQDVTELHQLSVHLPFETARIAPHLRTVRAFQDQLSLLLPLAAAVEDRIRQIGRAALPDDVATLIGDTKAWLDASSMPRAQWSEQAGVLEARAAAIEPPADARASWKDMVLLSLLARLSALIAAHRDCRDLREQMATDRPRPINARVAQLVAATGDRVLHRDHRSALRGALSAAVTMIIGSALWIGSGWKDGFAAVMMAGVFLSLFAAAENPVAPLKAFFIGTLVSTVIGAIYGYAILPRIEGFAMLVAVFAPMLLLLGALLASPKWGGIALPVLLGLGSPALISTQYVSDFASFTNSALAQLTGVWFAIIMARLLRAAGSDGTVRRIVRAGWRDIAQRANRASPPDIRGWINRMLDRVALLAPRLSTRGESAKLYDVLRDLRTGISIGELRLLRLSLDRSDEPLTPVLKDVAEYYRTLDPADPRAAGPSLLQHIDAAIAQLVLHPAAKVRRDALIGLVSLRRNLFPAAEPYRRALA